MGGESPVALCIRLAVPSKVPCFFVGLLRTSKVLCVTVWNFSLRSGILENWKQMLGSRGGGVGSQMDEIGWDCAYR